MSNMQGKGIDRETAIKRGIIEAKTADMTGLILFMSGHVEPLGLVTNQFSEGAIEIAVIDDDYEIIINGAEKIIQPLKRRTICRL